MQASIGTLEATLRSQSPAALAADARRLGDARRGAVVFYQPALTCTKCHVGENGAPALGPDLAALGKDVADAYLVESILIRRRSIKKGFETVTISTDDGRTLTGLLGRGPARRGRAPRPRAGRQADHDRQGARSRSGRTAAPSLMPAGLVNILAHAAAVPRPGALPDGDRREGAGAGPRAAARPVAPGRRRPCPNTRRDIDHAGLIARLDEPELRARRGDLRPRLRQLPRHEGPARLAADLARGSPSGKFKNGSDPLQHVPDAHPRLRP